MNFKKLRKSRKTIFTLLLITIIITITFGHIFFLSNKETITYALQLDQTDISAETYHAYVLRQTLLAQNSVAEGEADLADHIIEDMPASEWIEKQAIEQIIDDYVIQSELEKQQIIITDSDLKRLDTYLSQRWEIGKAIFEDNECTIEAFNRAYQNYIYKDLVFEKYQANHPIEDSEKSATTQIASVKYFILNKYSIEGIKYTDEETKELIKQAEEYVHELNDKSIDEVYKNHLLNISEGVSDFRPIPSTIIEADNESYTSKIPNFVEELMIAEVGKPFYVEDNYFITIGIKDDDSMNRIVQQAYQNSSVENAQLENFENYIAELAENVNIKTNHRVIKNYTLDKIKLSQIIEED